MTASTRLHLWRCDECSAPFRITHQESLRRAGVKCLACGSRFVSKSQVQVTAHTERMVGLERTAEGYLPVGMAVDSVNTPMGKRGSPKAEHRKAQRVAKLSTPTRYRLAVLRNTHERMKADRDRAAREQRIKDFTVFK